MMVLGFGQLMEEQSDRGSTRDEAYLGYDDDSAE
jgi:hypothetical protein